ncbi:MAG: PEP-CTERM sorting domain-containing protein [Planctomycetes bacterium]|nr:PEP-CTERM sorting domain-containing protein [Planctomycetota bacterium]
MGALDRTFNARRIVLIVSCLAIQTSSLSEKARAINIVVDYRYDTSVPKFFSTQQKKDALQAAADRYSAIITTSLSSASLTDGTTTDRRIGFTHPSTGVQFEVSAANSVASDAYAPPNGCAMPTANCYVANEYRGSWSIAANEWILYAGGQSLSSSAVGGTGTGLNSSTDFNSGSSHLNRGFRPSGSYTNRLPVWGGYVSFDSDGSTNWHFGLNTPAPAGTVDFYSIALHEIGHALGLNTNWLDWKNDDAGHYIGPNAVNAYNDDNNTSLSALNEVGGPPPPDYNPHWQDGAYDSFIFHNANPNYVGTVGPGVLQDLIMEPTANFTGSIKRFELTNVDVAALVDVGWSVVPQINALPGDYNENGVVDTADYVIWRKGFASGNYATWRANFRETAGGGSAAPSGAGAASGVPEPTSILLSVIAAVACLARKGRPSASRYRCVVRRSKSPLSKLAELVIVV